MHFRSNLIILGVILLLFTACAEQAAVPENTATAPVIHLTPYQSPTATGTSLPSDPATSTPAPTSTPTPIIHTVKEGETLLVIAAQYGVTVEAILAANPEVDPRIMSIGLEIIIPAGETPLAESTTAPPPVSISLSDVICYHSGESGSWCFVVVENQQESAVESVSVELRILDGEGTEVDNLNAAAPLNILPPGNTMPVPAYFSSRIQQEYQVISALSSALPYEETGKRYIPVRELEVQEDFSEDGSRVQAGGTVFLEDTSRAARVSVLAAAYDFQGKLVGMRVWRGDYPIGSEEGLSFSMLVYSLGPQIERMTWLAEAEAIDD